ncbi:hypothetical protein FKP32DRAFT_417520 [Trametes sanguinea]|nr:hypothetical protein FKP32DRAFT_417520 [Trametes sanguinea]
MRTKAAGRGKGEHQVRYRLQHVRPYTSSFHCTRPSLRSERLQTAPSYTPPSRPSSPSVLAHDHPPGLSMTDKMPAPPESHSSSASPTIHDEPGVTGPLDVSDENVPENLKEETNKGKAAQVTTAPEPREKTEDGALIINWDGPDDPQNPKNWSKKKKWAATLIVSAFTFISPVSSSMMAPASEQIAGQFGITNSTVIALLTSVFVAAYGNVHTDVIDHCGRTLTVFCFQRLGR